MPLKGMRQDIMFMFMFWNEDSFQTSHNNYSFHKQLRNNTNIKWLFHSELKIVSPFTYPQVVLNPKDVFIFNTQLKIFLMKPESFLSLYSKYDILKSS